MALWKGVDSFTAPTDAQLELAKADGCSFWNGYLPGPGIDSTWTADDFARIRAAGLHSVAYASQRADASSMRLTAANWGVVGCLDCEDGIQGFNAETQTWLDESHFGFYHNSWGYPNVTAPFKIVAAYQSKDPHASWGASDVPTVPHGWQWGGNLATYGVNCDRCWFDSEILVADPKPDPSPVEEEDDMLFIVTVEGSPEAGFWLFGNGNYTGIQSGPDETALRAAGAKDITVSGGQHERWRSSYPQGK
jgi:hypothetical protein